jgi:hypothetical protein
MRGQPTKPKTIMTATPSMLGQPTKPKTIMTATLSMLGQPTKPTTILHPLKPPMHIAGPLRHINDHDELRPSSANRKMSSKLKDTLHSSGLMGPFADLGDGDGDLLVDF